MEYFFAVGSEQRGPYTLEQLSGQGLRPDTLVWYEGLPEWRAASALPELASLFAPPQPIQPAVSPVAAPVPFTVQPLPYQPDASIVSVGGGQNGMAIASLVLGILSLVTLLCYALGLIPGILAIIFGVMARREIRRTGAQGYGMATAGLICGSIAVGLFVLGIIAVIIAVAMHH